MASSATPFSKLNFAGSGAAGACKVDKQIALPDISWELQCYCTLTIPYPALMHCRPSLASLRIWPRILPFHLLLSVGLRPMVANVLLLLIVVAQALSIRNLFLWVCLVFVSE